MRAHCQSHDKDGTVAPVTLTLTRWPYMNLTPIPSKCTGCTKMNFLRQGFRKLSSDRQTRPKLYTMPLDLQWWCSCQCGQTGHSRRLTGVPETVTAVSSLCTSAVAHGGHVENSQRAGSLNPHALHTTHHQNVCCVHANVRQRFTAGVGKLWSEGWATLLG